MYIYMYIYIQINIYTYIYTYICTYIYIYICIYMATALRGCERKRIPINQSIEKNVCHLGTFPGTQKRRVQITRKPLCSVLFARALVLSLFWDANQSIHCVRKVKAVVLGVPIGLTRYMYICKYIYTYICMATALEVWRSGAARAKGSQSIKPLCYMSRP